MAELEVGDLTVCQVTRVTSAVALATAQGMPGVIRGPSGSRASLGEHLKTRVTDFELTAPASSRSASATAETYPTST